MQDIQKWPEVAKMRKLGQDRLQSLLESYGKGFAEARKGMTSKR